jgi:hypothetical protein
MREPEGIDFAAARTGEQQQQEQGESRFQNGIRSS